MNDLLKYQLGLRLRRLWYTVKYFCNGETRRDKRELKAWAALSKKALRQRMIDDFFGEDRAERRLRLADQVKLAVEKGYLQKDRPYKGCIKEDHYDVIMRSRVTLVERAGSLIYEVNTKDMESWEIDEFHHMLRDRTKLHRPHPIIREVVSDRFPQ